MLPRIGGRTGLGAAPEGSLVEGHYEGRILRGQEDVRRFVRLRQKEGAGRNFPAPSGFCKSSRLRRWRPPVAMPASASRHLYHRAPRLMARLERAA